MSRATHPVSPEELMAYLDGELALGRARECAVHLEQCAGCQSLASDLRSVGLQMNAWQVESAPESLKASITAAIERHQEASPRTKGVWHFLTKPLPHRAVWTMAGIAALVAVIGLVGLFPNRLYMRRAAVSRPAYVSIKSAESAADQNGTLGKLGRQYGAAKTQSEEQNQASAFGPSASSKKPPMMMEAPATPVPLPPPGENAQTASAPSAPMIARTASLAMVVKDLEQSRAALDGILRRHGGYAAQLQSEAPEGQGRTLTATLRIPAGQLDVVLAEVKKLGRVERESQGGEEVTAQYVDLNARLSNARNTEQRLVEVLNQRTGKMADILAVENEIARVRGEIEQMEAERQSLEHRVAYSELQVELKEEYKAALEVAPPSEGAQLWNSFVDGLRVAADSLLGFVQILASCAPTLLLWGLILFWPARWLWRRRRVGAGAKTSV